MTIEVSQIVLLCVFAFVAGFVDAVVGGGGLIQTPAALVLLPAHPVSHVLGSVKIPSFSGTLSAALQYMRKVKLNRRVLVVMCVLAFFASFAGSELLTVVSNRFMKPVLLVVLAGVAVYTFTKKSFGQQKGRGLPPKVQLRRGIFIALIIGFYDGFIGPGTGSFLILAMISLMGFDFLHASAHAKMVNLATNLGSIVLFTLKGSIIWTVTLPMAACNALGGLIGARMAIAKGNRFIGIFFRIVVAGTLLRFLWDVVK